MIRPAGPEKNEKNIEELIQVDNKLKEIDLALENRFEAEIHEEQQFHRQKVNMFLKDNSFEDVEPPKLSDFYYAEPQPPVEKKIKTKEEETQILPKNFIDEKNQKTKKIKEIEF